MKFIFRDAKAGTELTLPVTPPSFEIKAGIRVETINIHTLGDVAVGGYGTLGNMKVSFMLPAQDYPFSLAAENPYTYIEKLKSWMETRTVLRFIVTGTPVNVPVLLSDLSYGERDGTGDVYAAISMREYRYLEVTQTQKAAQTGNASRPAENPPPPVNSHTVVKGDTMWEIARKHFGDGALCYKLAAYNGIPNANLIYPGQVVKLPAKESL